MGELVVRKQYMKIQGFKKFLFQWNLASVNENGRPLGTMSFEKVTTGRSKQQAFEKASSQFRKYFDDNFHLLNI